MGFGRGPRPSAGYNADAHADAVADTLHHLGVDGAMVVAGHSVGALVAMRLAVQHPELVAGVVAFAPPVHRDAGSARAHIARVDPLAGLLVATGDLAARACAFMCRHRSAAATAVRILRPDLPGPLADDRVEHSWPSYSQTLSNLVLAAEASSWLGEISVPVRILAGSDDDGLDHPYLAELADRHAHVTLDQTPGGHDLPLTAPELCRAAIRQALAEGRHDEVIDQATRTLDVAMRGWLPMTSHRIVFAVLAAAGLVLASCSTGVSERAAPEGAPAAAQDLAVAVASFDLSVGDDQRFLAGVLTPDRQVIGGGTVDMTFTHLGEDAGTDHDHSASATATGSFLPVPGTPTPADLDEPVVLGEPAGGHHPEAAGHHPGGGDHHDHDHENMSAAGVYQAAADFDRAGFWQVAVTAELDGEERTGTAVFEVKDEAEVPGVGEPAPRTPTLTLRSDAPAKAIDSRAGPRTPVPDEILHQVDLVEALDAGRPVVVVFSTPTYCTSRFCGPITEAVEELAHDYSDRAAFVHVEIWNDIGERRFNDAVQDWIVTDDGGNEPWVFLVDAAGTIAARWDNVLDAEDLTSRLQAFPPT